MKNNETFKAVLRFVITGILMANAILTAKGMNPIPFDEGAFAECVTYLASGVSAVWVWWKNNNVTRQAQAAKELVSKIAKGEVATVTVPEVKDDKTVAELDTEYEMGDE